MLLSRAQRPLTTTSRVVRDEEAAGSNPVTPTVFPQVIPEGGGPCQGLGDHRFGLSSTAAHTSTWATGQGSGGARPRSGRRALSRRLGRRTIWAAKTVQVGGSSQVRSGLVWCSRQGRGSRLGAGPGGLPVIPSPRQGRHDGVRGASGRRGQSEGATTPELGVMTCTTRADQGKAEGGVHAASGRGSRARTRPSRSA